MLHGRFDEVAAVDGDGEVLLLEFVVFLPADFREHLLLDVLSGHREGVGACGAVDPTDDVFLAVGLWLGGESLAVGDDARNAQVAGIVGHFKLPVVHVLAASVHLLHGERQGVIFSKRIHIVVGIIHCYVKRGIGNG